MICRSIGPSSRRPVGPAIKRVSSSGGIIVRRMLAGRRRGRLTVQVMAVALCCSAVLVAPHVAAAQRQAAAFVDSGTVTFVTDQTAADIDPANNEVAGASAIARNVDDPLVELDGSSLSAFKPMLATSWKTNA